MMAETGFSSLSHPLLRILPLYLGHLIHGHLAGFKEVRCPPMFRCRFLGRKAGLWAMLAKGPMEHHGGNFFYIGRHIESLRSPQTVLEWASRDPGWSLFPRTGWMESAASLLICP